MVRFVDTNVLICAVSPAPDEAGKQRTARRLLNDADLTLSAQVLQEFYYQVTRFNRPSAVSHNRAMRLLESLSRFPIQDMTLGVLHAAAAFSHRWAVILGRCYPGGGARYGMRRGLLGRFKLGARLRWHQSD